MMKYVICLILVWGVFNNAMAQHEQKISNIKWQEAGNLFITYDNDLVNMVDINELFHSNGQSRINSQNDYTYYPVVLGENFLKQIREKNISFDTTAYDPENYNKKYNTLWSGIHDAVGGGWIHFMNTLLYGLESGQLDLTAPLLKRPESNWKPNPVTESYLRTKKWKFYLPENQKLAIKEYKLKEKEGKLGDLTLIPADYIQLFLQTSNKEYAKMKQSGDVKSLAKIDLIRLLLGANYLGIPQIHYIKSMVLKSVIQYSINNPIPSVIVFDDLEAAVAMKLDTHGYHIEKVAFKHEERLSETEYEERIRLLKTIVSGINEINKQLFQKRLGIYYQ